jgi:hypothetical protein
MRAAALCTAEYQQQAAALSMADSMEETQAAALCEADSMKAQEVAPFEAEAT